MQHFPLVSVVTCSYNNGNYIIETLDSIKNQTYPNIELVIVDDCSTDNSVELIDKWLTDYTGKYKFIKNEKNLGGAFPYNIGLGNATGKYYSPLDSDDVILPEKIATQVSILENSDPDVAGVYSDAYVMNVEGVLDDKLFIQNHRTFSQIPSGSIYEQLLQGNYIPLLSVLFKRSVIEQIGDFDTSLVYGDYDLWLRIARQYKILFSDYISAKYRVRPGSLCFAIKNWDTSDAILFAKHAGGLLPMERVRGIAYRVYTKNDEAAKAGIIEMATKSEDRFLLRIAALWSFDIPPHLGELALAGIKGDIGEKKPVVVKDAVGDNNTLFLRNVAFTVYPYLLEAIMLDALLNQNLQLTALAREIAFKIRSKVLVSISLLNDYNVSAGLAVVILAEVREQAKAHGQRNINAVSFAEDQLFHDYIVPCLSVGTLQAIAKEAYCTGNAQLMQLVKKRSRRTGDRYFKAACLLSRFKINVPNGIIILDRIAGYCSQNLSNRYIDLCIYKDIFGAIRTYNSTYLKRQRV